MKIKAGSLLALSSLLLSPAVLAQNGTGSERDYSLGRGQIEASLDFGAVSQNSTSDNGYDPAVGVSGGVGMLAKGLSARLGLMYSKYSNGFTLMSSTPPTQYTSTANVTDLLGGLRYEFQKPTSRLGVYVEGGGGFMAFTQVAKNGGGCVYNANYRVTECFDPMEGITNGTRGAGYVGGGFNVSAGERWGFRFGMQAIKVAAGNYSQSFWWYQPAIGIFMRTR